MSLIVTAPVANRDWILPAWFEALAAQTVRPDEIMLLHGGLRGDATWQAIHDGASKHGFPVRLMHDDAPPHPRHDNTRFVTLARLRNQLLAAATILTDHDCLFSLDTDILLEDPQSIEKLLVHMRTDTIADALTLPDAFDVMAPKVYLHPDAQWTCNVGWLQNPEGLVAAAEAHDNEALGRWGWNRVDEQMLDRVGPHVDPVPVDVPCAAVMMSARVYRSVRYRWNRLGEDIGFGINLKLAGYRVGWLRSLECRHVWEPEKL